MVRQKPSCLETLPLKTWLHLIHRLSPAKSVLLLGAGTPASPLIQWLQETPETEVTLVEGDPRQVERLSSLVPASWELKPDIVSARAEKTQFHLASNPSESSLETPENLQPLWPQLSTQETISCQTQPLNQLLENKPNWLLIDFLAPAALLEGKENALRPVAFLLIRASTHKDLPSILQAETLQAAINELGFKVIHRYIERHPSIEQWLCIRQPDYTKTQKLANELKERNNQIASLEAARAEQENLANERLQRIRQLESETDEMRSRQKQLNEEITKTKDQIEQTTKTKNELEQRFNKTDAARAEQEKLANERLQRIKQLESETDEMRSRQTLVNEEIAKAEGQIELIKDVLLREQGI